MIRTFVGTIFGFYSAALIFVAPALGARECRDLFFAADKTSTLESKFIHSDLMNQFRVAVDEVFAQDIRVWIIAKPGAAFDSTAFHDVQVKRVLKHGQLTGRAYIQGSVDHVLRALRGSEIYDVVKMESSPAISKPRYFSKVMPSFPYESVGLRLSEKFESEETFKSFRKALRLTSETLYRVTIRVSGLPRVSEKFETFVSDIRALGIAVEPYSLKNQSKTLTFTGDIDRIHTVLRHPIVKDVIRFEENPSEEQLGQRRAAEQRIRARVRSDLLTADATIRHRIVIEGESEASNAFVGYRDPTVTSLIRFERYPRTNIAHEAQTAADYALFLSRNHGHDFAYVAELAGKSVPVFDGLILNQRTHATIANVSLKFASNPSKIQDLAHLKVEIEERFAQLRSKDAVLNQPDEWFRAANNLAPETLGQGIESDYDYLLSQAKTLKNLFGLFPTSGVRARETRIVVDMRATAFTVAYFKSKLVQDLVRSTLKRDTAPTVMLTLIWNDRQVVEVRRDSVTIFE